MSDTPMHDAAEDFFDAVRLTHVEGDTFVLTLEYRCSSPAEAQAAALELRLLVRSSGEEIEDAVEMKPLSQKISCDGVQATVSVTFDAHTPDASERYNIHARLCTDTVDEATSVHLPEVTS